MHMILRYPDRTRTDALLLLQGRGRIRVAIPGRDDIVELTRTRELWADEDGRIVTIEAIVADRYQGGRHTNTKYNDTADASNTAPAAIRSMTAGRSN
jgi:hypothetical protein